jgi:GTP:adenosylcobinamide-phosphate guanylyltransferase
LPPHIAASAFACFAIEKGQEIDQEVALAAISFLIPSAELAAVQVFDTAELAAVCDGFRALIPKAGPRICECAPAILDILIRAAMEFAIGVATEAAAELSIWAPELIHSELPVLLHVIETSAGRVEDLGVVFGAIHAIPILCNHLDLTPLHQKILDILRNCLHGVTGASAKSEVLHTFASLLMIESVPQELVLGSLVPALVDLAGSVNDWGLLYQEDSRLLLLAIAELLIQLLITTSGDLRSQLFNFSAWFIREVHQSTVVAQYVNGALDTLITLMIERMGIEPGDLVAAFQATLIHIFTQEELQAFLTHPAV